ncbi:hypothetical protein [Niallia nealsonii]|uniref:Uncharacterized protein n=1 Tax=Niallia nealsonii TaxID=115979 RepID=A0A2N0Z3R6_9BACI|nr:hypothetical protein [Niallia nealsonii]PKG24161.1 hypothetical protein CWS01_08835 [Niallia nealsonii]
MTKESKWSDEQIEELLRQLPALKDHRPKQMIYQQIDKKINKRRKRIWYIPTIATVCSLLLFLVIISEIVHNGTENETSNRSLDNSNMIALKAEDKIAKKEREDTSDSLNMDQSKMIQANAVYQEDIQNKEVLTYPIPDAAMQVVVPISIVADNPNHHSRFQLYMDNMSKLTEKDWHLKESYPIQADIQFDEKKKNVSVTIEKELAAFPSNGINFYSAIINQQLQNVGGKEVTFMTEDQPGIEFGNFGEKLSYQYTELENRGYFLLDSNKIEENLPFYVPSLDSYQDIETAFYEMRQDNEVLGLDSSIPDTIHFSKIVKDKAKGQLTLFLTNGSKLEENATTLQAIESILLTAKDFHFSSVKFENAKLKQIGRFSLAKAIAVPIAPNKREVR